MRYRHKAMAVEGVVSIGIASAVKTHIEPETVKGLWDVHAHIGSIVSAGIISLMTVSDLLDQKITPDSDERRIAFATGAFMAAVATVFIETRIGSSLWNIILPIKDSTPDAYDIPYGVAYSTGVAGVVAYSHPGLVSKVNQ